MCRAFLLRLMAVNALLKNNLKINTDLLAHYYLHTYLCFTIDRSTIESN